MTHSADPLRNPDSTHVEQPRQRGAIALIPNQCTSCMICVRECPVWCISLTAEKRHDPDAGPRGRSTLVLTDFSIDYGLCMDCGICIDACPTDALEWVAAPLPSASTEADLTLDTGRLADLRLTGSDNSHPLGELNQHR